MPSRTLSSLSLVLLAVAAACNAGPAPRDPSTVPDVPIRNTAAVVENTHAVTEVNDTPASLAVVAETDRDPRDRALDARYQGADLLTFLDVRPGMRVAELTAGGGYLTELLSRTVGASGQVFANEPPSLVARTTVSSALRERLSRSVNTPVTRVDRELASPLPARARNLDLVYLALPYRTVEALGVRTSEMNRAAFEALAPGGAYVVLDFRPRMNGPSAVNLHALHAQESTNVRRQVEAAGFVFVTEGRFLRNDANPNEWDAILASNPTPLEEQDRFLLEFVRP